MQTRLREAKKSKQALIPQTVKRALPLCPCDTLTTGQRGEKNSSKREQLTNVDCQGGQDDIEIAEKLSEVDFKSWEKRLQEC